MPNTIFQGSFLVAGIMCHGGCGSAVRSALSDLSDTDLLPSDAEIDSIDAQPKWVGVHEIFVTIRSKDKGFNPDGKHDQAILALLKDKITSAEFHEFEIVDEQNLESDEHSKWPNRINILINLVAMFGILVLSLMFPPSLFLTAILTTVSVLTTAFTGRNYLLSFLRNLRNKNINDMSSTISLGWLLSVTHTLYHSITMPLASSFSMVFMSFIMPVMLIAMVNGMDEIKRLVMQKSKTIHLKGMKSLFPQMAEQYPCYPVEEGEFLKLKSLMETRPLASDVNVLEFLGPVQALLDDEKLVMQTKQSLKQGMLIQVKAGECFPVDCILIRGKSLVDASLLTGEPQQSKQCMDLIPAGAINLGETVTVYAEGDSYNSTVNKLLFRSNRAPVKSTTVPDSAKFTSLYTGLIIVSIVAAVIVPLVLGVFTVPLGLNNVRGILFALCPCTIAIAHQLPWLLSNYQRSNKNILLRNENLSTNSEEIHTVVFDKTGTLTTGNSQVESYQGLNDATWQRIHLLEKTHGAGHPLAKAINRYYESNIAKNILFQDVSEVVSDPSNRGLSAIVQGLPIHIGSKEYMQQSGVELPEGHTLLIESKAKQGFTTVYVAEERAYKGVIFIQHEPRSDILEALTRLKKEGKTLIMLTGDNSLSAMAFNQQISAKVYRDSDQAIFEPKNIHAQQTPQDKEDFLRKLMNSFELTKAPKEPEKEGWFVSKEVFLGKLGRLFGFDVKPVTPTSKGIWFVGDGLNDAPCARIVTERGGVSCAMNSTDKAAFFTDISLNGSLAYLFEHHQLNRFFQKNIWQNQGLLVYSALAFLAFIISFSMAGVAVSPLIPMVIMMSTTVFTLFNCYRVKLSVDEALDKQSSWFRKFLVSDVSLGVLAGSSTLLMFGLLITTVVSKGLGVSGFAAGGSMAAIGSAAVLLGGTVLTLFTLFAVSYLIMDQWSSTAGDGAIIEVEPTVNIRKEGTSDPIVPDKQNNVEVYGKVFTPLIESPSSERPSSVQSASCVYI